MLQRNLATSLRRRADQNPMRAFDALPTDLRRWLTQASLPWSARSVDRLWRRALREAKGDESAAVARLEAAQQRLLARDARKVWGANYPVAKLFEPGK